MGRRLEDMRIAMRTAALSWACRSFWASKQWRTLPAAIALALWLGASLVSATAAQEADEQLDECRRHAAAVLQALRDDDLAAAMQALGEAADLSPGIHPTENDGLSAAAGGMYRALMQKSTFEQYELLYAWSLPTPPSPPSQGREKGEGGLPTKSRKRVRIVSTLVPGDAPPKEFARVLGERPRDTSFPVSEIGGIRGLFSTGWMLVQAADDIGRLRSLAAELETLAAENVPNADVLLMLARLADRRGDLTSVRELLEQRAAGLKKVSRTLQVSGTLSEPIDPSDIVLAAAALGHEELRPLSDDLFGALVEATYGRPSYRVRPFLRLACATAVQLHRGTSGPDVLHENRLKYWVGVTGETAARSAVGAINARWLVHEDHILHLAGAHNDVLFCRYPLTGEFDFTCEAQTGGPVGADGGLVYGGLHFGALGSSGSMTVWDADLVHQVQKPCPFVRHEDRPTFNRVSIRSTDDGAEFAVNLHPMWFDDDASKRSPWLGLRSFAGRRPIFRNLKLTGHPVIPREVRMSDGNQLRGWQSHFFAETQPSVSAERTAEQTIGQSDKETIGHGKNPIVRLSDGPTVPPADWTIQDGVIHAAKRETQTGAISQSLLRYQRPLLDGESIRYEFRYQPGEFAVHPALGRLALLIEPEGVRIHWITDGDLEWTTLPADNATLEPLNRRGPRRLPLNENDWNKVTLARAEGKVTLSLNETLVYERPIDFGGDQTFGLYRDRTQSAVRVRNVVMTGDWPESLPEEFLRNPAAVVDEPPARSDSHVLNKLIGEEFLSENVRSIRRQAARLPPADRFEFLSGWVLPGDDHPGLRVSGRFTQTDPSPIAAAQRPEALQRSGGRGSRRAGSAGASPSHWRRGGVIVSPVFDLLDTAIEIGRLKELRDRIADVAEPQGEFQQRAQAALLVLVNLELDNQEAASQAADELFALVEQADPQHVADMWPETLVVYRGVHRFGVNSAVADLLNTLYSQRSQGSAPEGGPLWKAHIDSLFGQQRHLQLGGTRRSLQRPLQLQNWIPLKRCGRWTRGNGFPHPRWHWDGRQLEHLPGQDADYVFFRSPLRGNFAVEADIGNRLTTQFFAAGKYFGPRWNGEQLEVGTFRDGSHIENVDPPLSHLDSWVRCRAVFRDRVRTIYLNGLPVHTEQLAEHHDPWIGFRSWGRNFARVRDVRITGDPQIPEAVEMSASEELTGWIAYYQETVGSENALWRYLDDPESTGQILGRRRTAIEGSFCESLLRYHRPLVEDGAIEYDFFYEPGQVGAHPSLDRLAFLLDPDGVRIHWITDGKFDPTDVPPDNVFDEPHNRRGPDKLPLESGDWNHMTLSITGSTVRLQLNGQPIYERELEPSNHRTFGLFHYADQTELRVRNVVMKGDWPKTLPPASEQELTDPVVVALDADLPKLTSVFTHDFAEDGVPDKYFKKFKTDNRGDILPRADGLHVIRPGSDHWAATGLKIRFTAVGDFDFEVSFDQFEPRPEGRAQIMLLTQLDDQRQHQCRLARILNRRKRQQLDASLTMLHQGGRRSYDGSLTACDAVSGTLRLARRDNTVYYLFAENDSSVFRLLRTEELSNKPVKQDEIHLRAYCNGNGETRVLWKDVTLRAEQLKYLPPQDDAPKQELFVMNANGSDVRRVTPPPEGFTHLGSPEWSADGRRIAFDTSTGSTTTSHIYLVNADGSGLKDLGPGCMPSFSRDGKQIVMSQPGRGIVMMDSDGSNRRVIDSRGWGVQFSPDGKYIAYGKSGNITLMNVQTEERRELLVDEHADRYSYIYWNLGWSHDSRSIAFKGRTRQGRDYEVAVADVDSPNNFQVLYATTGNISADFTFSPDNKRILFALNLPDHPGFGLYAVSRDNPGPPELFPGHPADHKIFNCAVSPDGEKLAVSSRRTPQPVDWPVGIKQGLPSQPKPRRANSRR